MDVVAHDLSQCGAVGNLAEPEGNGFRIEASIRKGDGDAATRAEHAMDLGEDVTWSREVVDAAHVGHEVEGIVGEGEGGAAVQI